MKIKLLTCAMLLSTFVFSQNPILNPSFENWTAGEPDDWTTNNSPGFSPIQLNPIANNGLSAVRGFVVQIGINTPYPPILSSVDANGNPHPVTQAYGLLNFYYKLSLNDPGESFQASIVMEDALGNPVGGGILPFYLGDNTNTYTLASLPISYIPGSQPTGANINFIIGDTTSSPSLVIGSHFTVDDVSLSLGSGITENETLNMLGNPYPNPAIDVINVPFSVQEKAEITLQLTDVLGREIFHTVPGTLAKGQYKEVIDLSGFDAGIYFCIVKANGKIAGNKTIILE